MPRQLLVGVVGGLVMLAVAASGLLFLHEDCRDFKEGQVRVAERVLNVAVARSQVEFSRGLAGCSDLPQDSGMYFVFEQASTVPFWMKGMVIPIDIVWIADGRVVGIERNVLPPVSAVADPPQYRPPRAVTGVLELAAHGAARLGITDGTSITLEP